MSTMNTSAGPGEFPGSPLREVSGYFKYNLVPEKKIVVENPDNRLAKIFEAETLKALSNGAQARRRAVSMVNAIVNEMPVDLSGFNLMDAEKFPPGMPQAGEKMLDVRPDFETSSARIISVEVRLDGTVSQVYIKSPNACEAPARIFDEDPVNTFKKALDYVNELRGVSEG